MKIILGFESSDGVPMLHELYNNLEDQINYFFDERFYGHSIQKIYTCAICVSKEFDEFCIVRKPKFLRKEPALEIEYKLDFQLYKQMENDQRLNYNLIIFLEKILELRNNSKIKDFDINLFVTDLKDFIERREQRLQIGTCL